MAKKKEKRKGGYTNIQEGNIIPLIIINYAFFRFFCFINDFAKVDFFSIFPFDSILRQLNLIEIHFLSFSVYIKYKYVTQPLPPDLNVGVMNQDERNKSK